MKRYSVIDVISGEEVSGPYWSHDLAVRMSKGPTDNLDVVTWVGHFGMPSLACVMEETFDARGVGIYVIQTACLYADTAERIKDEMQTERPDKRFVVKNVMLNSHSGVNDA